MAQTSRLTGPDFGYFLTAQRLALKKTAHPLNLTYSELVNVLNTPSAMELIRYGIDTPLPLFVTVGPRADTMLIIPKTSDLSQYGPTVGFYQLDHNDPMNRPGRKVSANMISDPRGSKLLIDAMYQSSAALGCEGLVGLVHYDQESNFCRFASNMGFNPVWLSDQYMEDIVRQKLEARLVQLIHNKLTLCECL